MKANIYRGDIFYADLGSTIGSEQSGVRPVLIVSNEVGNQYSSTVLIAAISSKTEKEHLPTHILIRDKDCGLNRESFVLLEQIRTIDKQRLLDYVGKLDIEIMQQIDDALALSFGLTK